MTTTTIDKELDGLLEKLDESDAIIKGVSASPSIPSPHWPWLGLGVVIGIAVGVVGAWLVI